MYDSGVDTGGKAVASTYRFHKLYFFNMYRVEVNLRQTKCHHKLWHVENDQSERSLFGRQEKNGMNGTVMVGYPDWTNGRHGQRTMRVCIHCTLGKVGFGAVG